ncbi:hypothetical protein CRG98_008439 [Punica granatum]|uniref:Retrotransposon gag domain-containing protein n=1 Tax=Punica granatum TaxID=22663 RepID=A0A2I0KRN5_PUNGR|nr:hypothetical protein CRG98_008439 [Punica granatum]
MAQNNQPASFEESTPSTPVYSQPPMTHAPPPPTPAGAPPAHSGAVPPPIPSPEARAPSTYINGAHIVTLEGDITTLRGTINQMAVDMAELMALLKGPNRASSSSTPPPGYRPTVDLNPWVPPTHAPESDEAPAMHAPAVHSVNIPPPSAMLSAAVPPLSLDPTMLAPQPMSIPASAPIYAAPPPMAAFAALPTNCPPETEAEQEQRLKKMEENIRALQSGGSRLDTGYGDWSLFPGMRLSPKIKRKDVKYWDYEEFVIHTFQDSLAGVALDWYMSLKAADIPTWVDLSSKFIDQYKYCAETPPTLLELNTMEMTEDQGFEAYAVKWRARAAKHVPSISEAQQIRLFHSTLTGAYYLHLLAHTSSFSSLIDAGRKLDMGVKLGKIERPTGMEGQDASVNVVSLGRQTPMPYQQQYPTLPINYSAPPAYPPPRAPQPHDHNYAPTPHWASPNRPLALRAPSSAQRGPTLQPRQVRQARLRLQYPPLPVPQSQVYRQLLAIKEIRPMAPHPLFNPANQDQNLRCEYHMGAPGHTTDDCYTLQGKLQEMIEKNQLSFSEVKPPNVQANPLPDHGANSDAAINLIGICPRGKDKAEEEKLISP